MRLALLALALFTGCVDPDAPVRPGDDTPFVFEVPKGSTAGGLGPVMVSEGLAPSELQWKLFLRGEDASCLKAGRFEVRRSMSMHEVLATLCGAPLSDDVPFTVVEGWRIRDIDAALTAKGWIEAGSYKALAESKGVDLPFAVTSPTLEGYLYPETYAVSARSFSAERLIERQLQTFKERFLDTHRGEVDKGRGLHAIVVMASMLEREEPSPTNRPLVAGILWKRVDRGWQLGVDATSRYDLPEWNDRAAFLRNLRDETHPYNTRHLKGLPPTAIGNPTVSSLEASLRPTPSEYWFYLHDAQGVLHPSRNGDEHDALRRKYDVW
ncbi:MAG: endolytic transglycosylase MltG [Deltaproteobacteria bacterium]|nr:endolytic transglycosylase MltG [Deltaproteobacteria bacterium]